MRELLQLVNRVQHLYCSNVIDALAECGGIMVCTLLPYHFEINPIELVWSHEKYPVAANNTEFNNSLVEGLFLSLIHI